MAEDPSLVKNKLLWQYLSAGGQDLLAGQPIGANVHQTTLQNMRSQNFANMLKQMLGQGGKLSMDGQNISFKAPLGAFQGPQGPGSQTALAAPQEAIGLGGGATPGPGVPTDVNQMKPTPSQQSSTGLNTDMLSMLLASGGAGVGNPSASPLDFSSSDLAGLMPEDISSALKFKMAQDEFAQSATDKAMTRALKSRELSIEEQKLQANAKDTAAIREYQYAVAQGYKGSFDDFRNSTASAGIKDYEYAKKQGYKGSYYQWKTELAESSRSNISIGDKLANREAEKKLESQLWFTSPTGMAEDMGKLLQERSVQNQLLRYPPGSVERSKAEASLIGNEIQSRIINAGGTVKGVKREGKTVIWDVLWDNKRRSEVRYVFK